MQFQNTIAYSTIIAQGGVLTIPDGEWTDFSFAPSLPDSLFKNIVAGNISDGNFEIQVKQTGMYFAEFNFIAEAGDSKNYDIRPYVNNVEFNTTGTGQQIKFYQQPTSQKYEVSTHGLFNLTRLDTLKWKIFRTSESALDFSVNTLRLNIFNLQQIGLH